MQHAKIIKRSDGSQVMITVTLYTGGIREDAFHYTTGVAYKGKGKQKWIWDSQDTVTAEEIQSAKLELWEKIKP